MIRKILCILTFLISFAFVFAPAQFAIFTCVPDPAGGGDYYCDQNIAVCSTIPGHFTGKCDNGGKCNPNSTAFTPCPGSSNGGPVPIVDCSTHNPCGDNVCGATLACITQTFPNVITAAFELVGAVAVIIFILAGIQLLMSRGDEKRLEGAKRTLTYAVIGLVVIFGSYLIVNIIEYVTGVHCIGVLGFNSCK